jgi:hypothetical protein
MLKWVAASLAAVLLSFGLIYAMIFVANAIQPGFNEDRFAGWFMVPILAAVMGTLQWLVLRRRLPGSGWWILGTAAGALLALGFADGVYFGLQQHSPQPWIWKSQPGLLVTYAIIGLSLGLAQVPFLWRRSHGIASWLLANLIGWLVLGLIVGASLDRTSDLVALGAIPAAFSGLGLIWLTRARSSLESA